MMESIFSVDPGTKEGREYWDRRRAAEDAATNTFAGYTAEQLAKALHDVIDGNGAWYDIKDMTGLPEDRCREVSEIFHAIGAVLYPR